MMGAFVGWRMPASVLETWAFVNMSTLYFLNVSVHVLAAFVWLGGMFFFAVVGAPVLRTVDPPSLRARLFQQLGRRFRTVGWWAIGILIVTGLVHLHLRGLLEGAALASPAFWASRFGTTLAWKLVAVGTMVVVSALHDFWLGPAASAAGRGDPRGEALRRWAAWLGRINALLGVGVVLIAVRLARGG